LVIKAGYYLEKEGIGMLELTGRILLSFITLLIMARIMGRKEISQMTFFNFISAITIGTIGGALITDPAFTIWEGVYSLIGWTLLTVGMGLLDIKSKKARKLIEGEPIVLINNGKIMDKAMRKVRLDVDALKVMLREKNVFSLNDVEFAIYETDGKLSVLKKETKQNLTKSDMNLQPKLNKHPKPTDVISDGVLNVENLSKLQLDQQWLQKQLDQAGIDSISDVFYAEVQKDGTLYIDKKGDYIH
jgi:uncharacterized membrane protein YcaP (DUF421 family)